MPQLSEIHAELSKPTLLDKLRDHTAREADQLLNKGKTMYVAKKTFDTLPSNIQTTLPKPLQEKLSSVAWPAFTSMLERMSKQAGVLGGLVNSARALPGAAKNVALGASEAAMHKNEIAGLGVLAVPGLDTLQASARAHLAGDRGHDAVEKRHLLGEGAHAALDVGGLGLLASPAVAHLKHAGALSRAGELITGSKAKKLTNAAKDARESAGRAFMADDSSPTHNFFQHAEGLLRKRTKAAKHISELASAEKKNVGQARVLGAVAAGTAAGTVARMHNKEAGVGVGAGMTASQYSGPLSLGAFKMVSGIPSFNNPELEAPPAKKQASAFFEECLTLLKSAGGMNSATDAMHAAGRLHATQSVGAPKTTAPAGPSIADIAKPKGYGTPIAGAKKNAF